MLLDLLVYAATAMGTAFGTLCLACGLYYLAELVEEYTVIGKRIIFRSLMVVLALHVVLCLFDRLPFLQSLFSSGCHLFYGLLLQNFPIIQLSDPIFLISCILAFVNHFSWFLYFTSSYHTFQFAEVATIFALLVWLVPFELFISLSASEYTLPSSDPNLAGTKRREINILKNLLNWVLQKKNTASLLPTSDSKGPLSPLSPTYTSLPSPYATNGSQSQMFTGNNGGQQILSMQ